MSDKRAAVASDPDAKRTVLATVPFSGLNELIAALQWLKEAPYLNMASGTGKYPVSVDIDKAGSEGTIELCSFSRQQTKGNFYGEEVNIAYVIMVSKTGVD